MAGGVWVRRGLARRVWGTGDYRAVPVRNLVLPLCFFIVCGVGGVVNPRGARVAVRENFKHVYLENYWADRPQTSGGGSLDRASCGGSVKIKKFFLLSLLHEIQPFKVSLQNTTITRHATGKKGGKDRLPTKSAAHAAHLSI